jgi:type IV/VI secretion system ImpK/VasF family protein
MKTTVADSAPLSVAAFEKHRLIVRTTRELLHWACVLRGCTYQFDIAKLHILFIHKIEEVALILSEHNCSAEEVDKIKFMLCTEIDEAMVEYLDTRELGRYRSLTEHYYKEQLGGEHFFDIIQAFIKLLHSNLSILSLAHTILCIGFKGQYALEENGLSKLSEIKDTLFFKIKKILPKPQFADEILSASKKRSAFITHHIKTKLLPLTLLGLVIIYGVLYRDLSKSVQQLHTTIYEALSL